MLCCRAIEETARKLNKLKRDSDTAVWSARKLTARLRGREQEIGLAELHDIALDRLNTSLSWVSSRNSVENVSPSAANLPVSLLLQL